MEALLVKVFATALALSLVMTRPDAVKTQFDPATDKAEVLAVLGAGCDAVKKSFDIENIDLDGLIDTVMVDKQAAAGEIAGFKGIKFDDLHLAYKQLCKHEKIDREVIDVDQVIEFYNRAAADLPDHNRLKGLKLPGMTTVLDGTGAKFAELFEPDSRRHWVPLTEIPEFVQKAFVAAEDKQFFQHKGVDIRSVTRAFMNSIGGEKRQGGSTITQQVAKNLLVGDSLTFERKIREVIVASRIEKTLTKQEILEIYLNSIYLGRSSWGIDLAARAYFGKPVKDLSLAEGAFIAGLTKGPAYYNPDRYRDRAHERLAYVLARMKDDGAINAAQATDAEAERLNFVNFARVRRDTGFHLVDEIGREARTLAGVGSLTSQSYEIRSTIRPALQRAAEAALQEGLAQYEQSAGRVEFRGPEANLSDAIRKIEADRKTDRTKPSWLIALEQVRLPLYDVHWTPAVVVEKKTYQGADSIRVGLKDGRVLPLSTFGGRTRARINQNDVVYVKVFESTIREGANRQQTQSGTRVELRVRPTVQGTTLVLENKTGRVLAMVGGFSYPVSQLNRVTQARRQPGSSFKPMTYLAALNSGLQPNTLVEDAPITLSADRRHQPLHPRHRLLVAAQLRRRLFRHFDDPARAGDVEEPGDRASARRRHLRRSGFEPRPDLQARDRGRGLSEMRAVLSVRARRPAGATDRPGGVLCRNRQRGQTPDAARGRADHPGRPRNLQGQRKPAPARVRRPRGDIPAPHVFARRGGAWHGGAPEQFVVLHWWQNRHQRRFQ